MNLLTELIFNEIGLLNLFYSKLFLTKPMYEYFQHIQSHCKSSLNNNYEYMATIASMSFIVHLLMIITGLCLIMHSSLHVNLMEGHRIPLMLPIGTGTRDDI